jgi:O-antigen ligase
MTASTYARLDRSIFIGLIVALAFAVLAHGAVEAWSVAIFELIITVLVALWAVKMALERRFHMVIPPAAIPLVLLITLGLLEIALDLSMDVEATRGAVVVLLFLLVSFIIGANFLARRERLRAFANFLIIFGFLVAVFALIQDFTWDGRFYWLRPSRYKGFGPYVNRNHFAGLMEMIIPLPVALLVTGNVKPGKRMLYGFAAAVMGVAVVVSLSRGGSVGLVVAMMFIAFVSNHLLQKRKQVARHRRWLSEAGAVMVIAIAILVGIFWIGAEPVINRAADTIEEISGRELAADPYSRHGLWRDTWAIFRANPILGAGLGAYKTVYPIYASSNGAYVVDYAHNDYLQVLADGGAIGGVLALCFILIVFRTFALALRSHDRLLVGLAIGSGASCFALFVHSLFDFNLQLPSNALLFLLHAAVLSSAAAIAIASEAALQPAAGIKAASVSEGV